MNNEYWLSGQPLHYLKIKTNVFKGTWLGLAKPEEEHNSVQTSNPLQHNLRWL